MCGLARRERFPVVLVEPFFVPHAGRFLRGSTIRVGTVAGYPFGANEVATKVAECARSLALGATDIDMVMNIGAFKSGLFDAVRDEIASLATLVHEVPGRILKVIIETGYLTPREIQVASLLVIETGADFVKTGTGYGPRAVSVDDVATIRRAIGSRGRVKAAGGIASYELARELIEAGADRIGASRPLDVLAGAPSG